MVLECAFVAVRLHGSYTAKVVHIEVVRESGVPMPPMSNPFRKYSRYIVAFVALVFGLYFSVANSDRGWLVPSAQNLFATPDLVEGEYDLQALNIVNRALLQIKDNYVEPERIDPERMLVSALYALQDQIPQVVARFDRQISDSPTEVELQVNEAVRTFDVAGISSLWEMSFRLREIFRFVQENLEDDDVDLRLVEYAAINGMLDTLDPHSVLLSPEVFADMQANNRGSFGGLGIVISIRRGQLTIISPIDGTPAHRAGLRSGDQILKIGEESTINMNIEEAVSRLRGDPGTAVTIDVMREGWSIPHEFTIVRERISIESVKSQVLGSGIGYISISNFQANTHDDLLVHLNRLREEMGELNGLVLDLRDNPGGLLEQAIRVADAFLDDGTIVTTVGEGHRLRDEKKATEEGTEAFYPIVVLINPGSASASEIVAGALQNHGRALIVGQRSFGKGSVQVLYEFQDGSALKLTIAQYLTPGDISIQGVGIVPDVALVPMTATAELVDLFPSESIVREGDLDSHLNSDRAGPVRSAEVVLRFYSEPEPELDPDEIVDPSRFELDFEIEFAQRLLEASNGAWRTEELLPGTESVRDTIGEEQLADVSVRLQELGVDWSDGENPDEPNLSVVVSTDSAENEVAAGGTVNIAVEVTNNGAEPVHRLRGVSHCGSHLFDDHEFVFGRVDPGESRSWSVAVEVPIEEPTRMDRVSVDLRLDNESLEQQETIELTVAGSHRPHFAFAYQIIDDEAGNGDGLLQLDEDVTFKFSVSNEGRGDGSEMLVYIKNEVEAAILLEHGRETWEDGLAAGETRSADFKFRVQHRPEDGMVRLEAAIYDTVFREFTSHELIIPVQPEGDLNEAATGFVRPNGDSTLVFAGADESTPRLAIANQTDVLTVVGRLDEWVRVDWAPERFGWVKAEDVTSLDDEGTPTILTALHALQPPLVRMDDTQLWAETSTINISGNISDDGEVVDYYVWVSGETEGDEQDRVKVSYRRGGSSDVAFNEEIPLYPGINRIVVIARDDQRMTSSAVVYVFRRTTGDAVSDQSQDIDPG